MTTSGRRASFLSIGRIREMAACVEVVTDRLFSRAPIDPLTMFWVHRYPVKPLRNTLTDDRHLACFHVVQAEEAFTHPLDLVRVCPVGLVHDQSVAIDQIDHVGQQPVSLVRGAVYIVHQDWQTDALQLPQFSCVCQLLLKGGVMPKILSRMRFPHINDKELKSSGLILLIKLC